MVVNVSIVNQVYEVSVRWVAPESMEYRKFTKASDVTVYYCGKSFLNVSLPYKEFENHHVIMILNLNLTLNLI